MNVSVETTGSLGRRLKFTVPSSEVEKQVADRLQRMRKNARIDGFRPGKVPVKVIRERYGDRVFREVASEVMESSYQEALAKHDLKPAGQPDFKDANVLPGQDMQFVAEIELYPEFRLAGMKKMKVEKPVAEVCPEDVSDTIERLRLRHAEWRSVERPAREGDRVRVHLNQRVEVFSTDENGDLTVAVGGRDASDSEGVLSDFGRQLLGAEPGSRRKIRLRLPHSGRKRRWYARFTTAKKVKFEVEVRVVEESILPPLERDFFERCGVKGDGEEGLKALKEIIEEGMKYELQQKLDDVLRKNLTDALLEENRIEAPRVMVQREIERMRSDVVARLGGGEEGKTADSAGKLKDDLFREQAERRVKVGLIVGKVAADNRFEVSEREFEAELERMVAAYEDAEATRRYYRNDQRARSLLVSRVIEAKVWQWVTDRVRLEEKPSSFKEVMRSA